MECFICRKQAGLEDQPPGGYFYQDANFQVCHAPAGSSGLGTLLVESRRHFLDFESMLPAEANAYGVLLRHLFAVIRSCGLAERIYLLVFLEGVPHFHAWLVPRPKESDQRSLAFLTREHSCDPDDIDRLVPVLAVKLAESLSPG